jgi:hypothetical protein
MREIGRLAQTSKTLLTTLQQSFDKAARQDYAKWDCDAMYPMPVKFEVSIIKVLTEAVKEGFAIFNQVKGMLPEGTLSNIKIPGLPEGMQENITKGVKMFNEGKAAFEKYGKVAE